MGLAALLVGCAWLAGVYLGAAAPAHWPLLPLGGVAGALLALLYRRPAAALLLGLGVAALAGGAWRYQAALSTLGGAQLDARLGQIVTLRGVVAAEPTPRGHWADLVVAAEEVGSGGVAEPASGRVLVRSDGFAGWRLGDRLELVGRLEVPADYGSFRRREHLARQGVRAELSFPRTRLLARDQASWPELALSRARAAAAAVLARALAEPAGSLAQGILLGERDQMSRELRDAFEATNTTHLLAVSGMNVALLVAALQPATRLLPGRWLGLGLTLLSVAVYVALVGGQPSAVRAGLMGGLAAWGRSLGRPADALTGLSLSALAMTAYWPLWLWDLGFQLSCLTMAGLILLTPSLEARLVRLPGYLRASLGGTLAAQAPALPVLLTIDGLLSPVSPLANLLAAPVFGPAMAAGLLAVGPGLLWEPLAAPGAWLTWLLLTYLARVVEAAASLPLASASAGQVAPSVLWVYYLALLLAALRGRASPLPSLLPALVGALAGPVGRVRARWLLLGLSLAAALAWAGALSGRSDAALVTFLDVGQGDATLVLTPSGRSVLVDGGPDPAQLVRALDRRLPFWRRRLDLVVLTHPHDDHLAGLTEVLARYEVGLALEGGLPAASPAYARWERLLAERGVRRLPARAGLAVALGDGLELAVLHPPEPPLAGTGDDANENSAVLRLSRGPASLLLLGDAGPVAQRRLLAGGLAAPALALKVPHHGGAGALDDGFLAAVAPRLAVISVGGRNRFGHPAPATLEQLRGARVDRVYRTDLVGSVELALTAEGLGVATER